MSAVMKEDALFRSTEDALRFALRFDHEIYDQSMLAQMASGPRPFGRGLGGLEGAGTAGMIQAQMCSLPQLWRRILTARYCGRAKVCGLCKQGKLPVHEWVIEVAWISSTVWLELSENIPLLKEKRNIRDDLVMMYFGHPFLLQDIAKRAGVHRNTMRDYYDRYKHILRKEEKSAFAAIEERLMNVGIVG